MLICRLKRDCLRLTELLLQRLSAERAWIAKLLARELVDPACGAHTYVASGLERDFVLLQAVMRDLLGARPIAKLSGFMR